MWIAYVLGCRKNKPINQRGYWPLSQTNEGENKVTYLRLAFECLFTIGAFLAFALLAVTFAAIVRG
jgi:hypothetical protein